MENLPFNNTDSVSGGTHENEVSKNIICIVWILVSALNI